MGTKDQQRLLDHNAAVLANANDLVVLAAQGILGKTLTAEPGGCTLNESALRSLVSAKIKNHLGL